MMKKYQLEDLAELLELYHDEETNDLSDEEAYVIWSLMQTVQSKAEQASE
jgi:hypothetical protein